MVILLIVMLCGALSMLPVVISFGSLWLVVKLLDYGISYVLPAFIALYIIASIIDYIILKIKKKSKNKPKNKPKTK